MRRNAWMAACGVTCGYRPMAKKILIVDDEEEIRAELAEYLLDKGYEVEEVADGLEALDNRNDQLLPASSLGHYQPTYSVNEISWALD